MNTIPPSAQEIFEASSSATAAAQPSPIWPQSNAPAASRSAIGSGEAERARVTTRAVRRMRLRATMIWSAPAETLAKHAHPHEVSRRPRGGVFGVTVETRLDGPRAAKNRRHSKSDSAIDRASDSLVAWILVNSTGADGDERAVRMPIYERCASGKRGNGNDNGAADPARFRIERTDGGVSIDVEDRESGRAILRLTWLAEAGPGGGPIYWVQSDLADHLGLPAGSYELDDVRVEVLDATDAGD